MILAAPWPEPGCVIVVRAHASPGATGWYKNEHNDAVGWYWIRSGDTGPVVVRRADAMTDAMTRFPNIMGFERGPGDRLLYAVVRKARTP